ncbi:TraB/GumN family protein [Ruegeria pomeroyi]|nr:TraB/GumN family protein [Ruegeria pomeroyi]NVK98355.1 TraB/GumN family protein [Ruegeria pomeroyi]NVL00910.1 TraB/GumN family protein [Ruegeria pomeroyi]QWV09927.1 TraB/GumN family protein [Ruegeria pomeroyi]HCE72266.1 TraB/GumN family protein [Ruegeria sp.]
MFRVFVICLCLLAAGGAAARCTGTDMRDRLTPEAEARLTREIKQVPFAYGNHWVATKGNRRIHVIGTQHTGDSRMRAAMRNLTPVIRSADAVLLEVTQQKLATLDTVLRSTPGLLTIPKGPGLDTMMRAEDWRLLSVRMAMHGVDERVLARMQPWFISMSLSTSGCGGRGLFAYRGLDDRIEKIAIRAKVPIGSLENVGDGMRALSAIPIRDQIQLLLLDLKSEVNYDDQVVTMANAYFEQRLAEAMLIESWTLYRDLKISRSEVTRLLRQFDAHILDRRNRAWMPVILASDAPVLVVAVGAAHLPGKTGILNLLKRQGYSLSRADF